MFSKDPDVSEDREEMEDDIKFWSLLFIALAVVMLIGNVLQVRENIQFKNCSSANSHYYSLQGL